LRELLLSGREERRIGLGCKAQIAGHPSPPVHSCGYGVN